MADSTILQKVKNSLGITGNYQDDTLSIYIDEVISYMVDAGVPSGVANSVESAGVISRGVTDLWNYGSGGGKLSDYFYQRVTQLCYRSTSESEPSSSQEILRVSLNVDSEADVKSGSVAFTDGSKMSIDIVTLPALFISATDVNLNESTLTTLTVSPLLTEGNSYVYSLNTTSLPALDEVVDNSTRWKEWDGASQIDTDGQERLALLELTADKKAVAGGVVSINIIF